ncbi:hypothetical protein [Allocoleopsis franciscana]|uniref:Uncharacterized protein n=1 Tax=Allocoleopsis franciscana PCC 7113 TaxID=1173027 RepID=K9WPS3_9CYAN|nr:hypothetical protein [Allocoleopsis franciscana]AFZ22168.1 hypothetical protein Mic7113_6595 [Allocoleopsis franciscana PCC 7113]
MNPFVGVKEQLLTVEELKNLLQQSSTQPNYYFLRWPHKVSGIVGQLPNEFPSPEGQMFNYDRELRWKQQGQHFSVLLLSTTGAEPGFKPIGQKWETQQRDAHIYPATETRFPKGLSSTNVDVAQRYFMDADTATVHFVALTVAKKQ